MVEARVWAIREVLGAGGRWMGGGGMGIGGRDGERAVRKFEENMGTFGRFGNP